MPNSRRWIHAAPWERFVHFSEKRDYVCRLQKWFKNSTNYPKPLKNGVALTEFEMLSKMLPERNQDISDLETIISCQ